MKSLSQNRKILFIEGEPAHKELFRTLLAKLDCEGKVAVTGQQGLEMISREEFDAVLLDLRSSDLPPEEVVSGIHEMRPSLVGRVLVISGEVDDPATLNLMERHFLLKIPRTRLINDLVGCLRALLCIPPLRRQLPAEVRRAER